jgi:hypothetical protein
MPAKMPGFLLSLLLLGGSAVAGSTPGTPALAGGGPGAGIAAAAPPAGQPPLEVAQWRWTEAIQDRRPIGNYQRYAPDQPLYLWVDLHGTEAAIDMIRSGRAPRILVLWRHASGPTPGAPDLVTPLRVGAPGLADRLEHEVREKGYFDWPAWARKDTLSPGRWVVELTDPNGNLLPCAAPPGPSRFTIEIG